MSAAVDAPPRGQPATLRVLVVDDHQGVRETMRLRLSAEGFDVEAATTGEDALARLADPSRERFDVVLSDLRLPGADGIAVLQAALAAHPDTAVFVMTAYATIDTTVRAVRLGARHVFQKPFEFGDLLARVESECHAAAAPPPAPAPTAALAAEQVTADPVRAAASTEFVAESPSMREAVAIARRVAPGRSTVLITGETGTGKELVAELIHAGSDRRTGPFVKVNCAALPETLLESELFGHERGAFTGADRRRIGRFEEAHGGTLFLDEIGDMAPATQAKLLRVLQDREFFRLGGSRALRSDVRIVAATNQDLERAQREGRFRPDLYFRLDVIGIQLAPLRERPEDIEGLVEAFARQIAAELGREPVEFDAGAERALRDHAWPGNVRELRNVVERAVLMAPDPVVRAADLGLDRRRPASLREVENDLATPGVSLSSMERRLVLAALEHVGWVQKEAAELLEVSPRKLNYMIQRMGITHPSWRRNRDRSGSPRSRA